jgi:hypothetical protein
MMAELMWQIQSPGSRLASDPYRQYAQFEIDRTLTDSKEENSDQVNAARIPNYCKHDFLRLNRLPSSFRNLFFRSKPDELMVGIEAES